jgi:predicted DNA-binding transcriptional regulator AlpA
MSKIHEVKIKKLLTINDLAEILSVTQKTIRNNRCRFPERVPPAILVGGAVRWDPEAVERWLSKKTQSSKSTRLAGVKKVGRPKKECSIGA